MFKFSSFCCSALQYFANRFLCYAALRYVTRLSRYVASAMRMENGHYSVAQNYITDNLTPTKNKN